ncbi:predicted protein [Fibroporia radiculosa]|uniref:Uncharacterized protein n=1 Tax=Fibroporia radiculosa TaxID=599839 RepID=J7SD03_9APHY|nr:predicted protein [Fibroporia radiculosa]
MALRGMTAVGVLSTQVLKIFVVA